MKIDFEKINKIYGKDILDGLRDNLDEVNKLSVLHLIEFAIEDLHLQQVFIISHDELNKLLPTTITVVREVDKSIIKEGP